MASFLPWDNACSRPKRLGIRHHEALEVLLHDTFTTTASAKAYFYPLPPGNCKGKEVVREPPGYYEYTSKYSTAPGQADGNYFNLSPF